MIQMGVHPEWQRIGDNSAYGGVFKSKKYPGKVIKVQNGDYQLFDNEINRQFGAQLGNKGDYEVPQVHESDFFPNDKGAKKTPNNVGVLKYDPYQTGISYILMDEADFDNVTGGRHTRGHATARGFVSLYNDAGVSHTDDHVGNVKWNSKTGKPVILDFGLAQKADGTTGQGKRIERLQTMLRDSGNVDMLDFWDEQHAELYGEHIQNPTKETKAALDDWIRQGEEVGLMTDPKIEPVNWTEQNRKMSDIDSDVVVQSSGAKEWKKGGDGGMSPPSNKIDLSNLIKQLEGIKLSLNKDIKGSMGTGGLMIPVKAPVAAGLSVGAADLIPSRQTVQTAFKDGPVPAAQNHAYEFARGLPYGAGAAALTMAAPVIAPYAVGVGGGMIAQQGAEAVDEVVKQTTGEGVLSKFRQAIGTEERTGIASPGGSVQERNKREMDRVINPPTITPTKTVTRKQIKDLPMPEVGRRLRLAGDRFNPSKLEFGISEILFGR